jgi:uncharacterized protein DUF3291
MPDYHVAQLNIARLRAPIDSPRLAPFVAQLDPVNALADAAPGFVWRLVADGANDATQIRPYEDETVAVNLSVWTSLEALWNFVYRSVHLDVMRRRREFFHRMHEPYEVLWWLPAGELPSVEDAVARLRHLRAHGPSAHAFTFKQRYPAPEVSRGGR